MAKPRTTKNSTKDGKTPPCSPLRSKTPVTTTPGKKRNCVAVAKPSFGSPDIKNAPLPGKHEPLPSSVPPVDYGSDAGSTTSSQSRPGLAKFIIKQLATDIEEAGGIAKFVDRNEQQKSHLLMELLDKRPDTFQRRGHKVRNQIQKLVWGWGKKYRENTYSEKVLNLYQVNSYATITKLKAEQTLPTSKASSQSDDDCSSSSSLSSSSDDESIGSIGAKQYRHPAAAAKKPAPRKRAPSKKKIPPPKQVSTKKKPALPKREEATQAPTKPALPKRATKLNEEVHADDTPRKFKMMNALPSNCGKVARCLFVRINSHIR